MISNKTESVKYVVSANKVIIETHVSTRSYYNCPGQIIEKTKTRVATEAITKINVT